MVYELVDQARPAYEKFGLGFVTGKVWNPVTEIFGALPAIYGTLISSTLALVLAVPISLGAAIFLAELAPNWLRTPASYLIETLAAIPSVIFGLWALFVLVPRIRDPVERVLADHFSWIPLFNGPQFGVGLLSAGVILAIMILPIITSLSRDIMLAVPNSQREAMLALGATKWEVDLEGGHPLRALGVGGRGHPGPRPRDGRDHGGDDGHRQLVQDIPSLYSTPLTPSPAPSPVSSLRPQLESSSARSSTWP